VTVIVINWNAGKRLKLCVDSILVSDPSAEVVVVDNDSTDESLDALVEDARLRIIQTGENLGYGRAANVGLANTEDEVVGVMNPDLVVDRGALDALVDYLKGHPEVGVVGPALRDPEDRPLQTCGFRPRLSDAICRKLLLHLVFPFFRFRRVRPVEPSEVDWVTGACLVGRREAFSSVDGFDEAIFMYFEDVDLCLRLKAAGWQTHYVPTASAQHVGGHSSAQAFDRMLIASDRSYRFFTERHLGRFSARLLSLLTPIELALRSVGWLAVGVLPSKREGALARLRAYRQLFSENLSFSPERFRGSVL